MKRFEIWFGKDPEELEEYDYWPDSIDQPYAINGVGRRELTENEFKQRFVHEVFQTDNKNEFIDKHYSIHENPPAMWYWVLIDGDTFQSGAIDPDDIYYFEKFIKETNNVRK